VSEVPITNHQIARLQDDCFAEVYDPRTGSTAIAFAKTPAGAARKALAGLMDGYRSRLSGETDEEYVRRRVEEGDPL
jgi:hypothetical protein